MQAAKWIQLLLGITVVIMSSLWLLWMLRPDLAYEYFQVLPQSTAGISTLKSDVGGALLSIGVFLGLYLKQGNRHWLYSAMWVIGLILGSRILCLLIDGWSTQAALAALLELVALVIFYQFAKLDQANSSES